MRFKIDIGGTTMVLDAYTLERVIEIVADNECYARNWSSSAVNTYEIKPVSVDDIKVTAMTQATYDTIKLAMKLAQEK